VWRSRARKTGFRPQPIDFPTVATRSRPSQRARVRTESRLRVRRLRRSRRRNAAQAVTACAVRWRVAGLRLVASAPILVPRWRTQQQADATRRRFRGALRRRGAPPSPPSQTTEPKPEPSSDLLRRPRSTMRTRCGALGVSFALQRPWSPVRTSCSALGAQVGLPGRSLGSGCRSRRRTWFLRIAGHPSRRRRDIHLEPPIPSSSISRTDSGRSRAVAARGGTAPAAGARGNGASAASAPVRAGRATRARCP
jgi:hypothetical protein